MVFGSWKRASLLLFMVIFCVLGILVSGSSFKLFWSRASATDTLENLGFSMSIQQKFTSSSVFSSEIDLVKEAMQMPTNNKTLEGFAGKGKVVVWDLTKNDDFASYDIDKKILWDSGDPKGYVVIIDRYFDTKVSSFVKVSAKNNNSIPGYRRDASLYVYDLKVGKFLGTAIVLGDEPLDNYTKASDTTAIYGDIEKPLAKWLNSRFGDL